MKRHISSTLLFFCLGAILAMPAYPGCDEGVTAYRRGDYATALLRFTEEGSAHANFYLSLMYEKGDGVPQSREKAVTFLRMAAEQGLDVAQADLGIMYYEGIVVKRDMAEGLSWLRKAAEQGLPEAQIALQANSNVASTNQVLPAANRSCSLPRLAERKPELGECTVAREGF